LRSTLQTIAPHLEMLDGPDCPENVTGAAAVLHFFTRGISRDALKAAVADPTWPPAGVETRRVIRDVMKAFALTLDPARSERTNPPTLQREPRMDEGAPNGLGVFFGYTAGAQGLVPGGLDPRLHVVDDFFSFAITA